MPKNTQNTVKLTTDTVKIAKKHAHTKTKD